MTAYVVQHPYQPIGSNAVGALEVRATTPTLPDPDELANLEGRAEKYEAEAMRLQTENARLQSVCFQYEETTRLAQDQTEALRREVKFLRARDVELTVQTAEALRLRDIAEEENENLKRTNARLREDVLALGGCRE
jgi:chromosome segregation ATPase